MTSAPSQQQGAEERVYHVLEGPQEERGYNEEGEYHMLGEVRGGEGLTGRIEPSSRISIGKLLLKSLMLYPLPTGTLQLHCEQFWTFIVYTNAHAQCDVQHTHTHTSRII